MRRGLLAWSEEEVPREVLEARVARLQAAMAADGLGAVLIYTSFPRPSGVSFLTHFVPYWSQGMLAVFPEGEPVLLVSLSKRVAGWIEETAKVDEIICTPAIGKSAATLIAERAPDATAIGIVEMSKLPGGIGQPLKQGLDGVALQDASALFRQQRHPADQAERALSARAAGIAIDALDRLEDVSPATSGAALELLEGACRHAGAEDVLILIAPDLANDETLLRMENSVPLGPRYGIRLSVAYKGHWVRFQRNFFTDQAHDQPTEAAIEAWLAGALPALGDGSGGLASLTTNGSGPEGLKLSRTVAEASIGCAPLTEISVLDPGSVVNLTMSLKGSDGNVWLAGEPVLLADGPGKPALRLVAQPA